jgi:hypothetical protein
MTKKIFAIFLMIMLCGCEAEPVHEVICYTAEPTTTAVTTEFIPTFSPSPIIAEDVSEDGALKLTVKMHDDEFVTFEKITATVTLENLTDEDYNFVFGGGDVVDNKPPLYCGFWTEAEHETLAYPMLSIPITFTPGQILTNTVEFTPQYGEFGEYVFFADMPYSKDGVNYFLAIEPIKFNISPVASPYYHAEHDQSYKSLPYYDDFSDEEFTYRYLSENPDSICNIKDGCLYVYSDYDHDRTVSVTIGNYYFWSYYTASVDFLLTENGKMKMFIYLPQNACLEGETYGFAVDYDGNWYAGNSRGIHDHERGEMSAFGTIVTGKFEEFNPDVWNTVSMISEDGKLYISLNSGEKVYVCDLDPNAVGAVRLGGTPGIAFDNLEIISAE